MTSAQQISSEIPAAAPAAVGPALLESKSRVTNITRSVEANAAQRQLIAEFVRDASEPLRKAIGIPAFLNGTLTKLDSEELLNPLKQITGCSPESKLTAHLAFSKDLLAVSLRDQNDLRHGLVQYNYPRNELYRFADASFYAGANSMEQKVGEIMRQWRESISTWSEKGGRALAPERRNELALEIARAVGVPDPAKTWIHIGKPTSFCFDYDRSPIAPEAVSAEVTLASKRATNLYSIASFVSVPERENPYTQLFRAPG